MNELLKQLESEVIKLSKTCSLNLPALRIEVLKQAKENGIIKDFRSMYTKRGYKTTFKENEFTFGSSAGWDKEFLVIL